MAQDPTKKEPRYYHIVTDPNLEEEIRRWAYALYEQRGGKMAMTSMTGSTPKAS